MKRFYATVRGFRRSALVDLDTWEAFAGAWVSTVEELYPAPHAPGSSVYDTVKFAGVEVKV